METSLRVGAAPASAELIMETDTRRQGTGVASAPIASQSLILFLSFSQRASRVVAPVSQPVILSAFYTPSQFTLQAASA